MHIIQSLICAYEIIWYLYVHVMVNFHLERMDVSDCQPYHREQYLYNLMAPRNRPVLWCTSRGSDDFLHLLSLIDGSLNCSENLDECWMKSFQFPNVQKIYHRIWMNFAGTTILSYLYTPGWKYQAQNTLVAPCTLAPRGPNIHGATRINIACVPEPSFSHAKPRIHI